MTQDRPPPARPWHDLVTREAALRGWTKTELSERSGVARTTIDNWRTNSRRPSAKAVNAVADVLGIDRAQAHVLAGIVMPDDEPGEPGRWPHVPQTLVDGIMDTEDLTDAERRAVLGAVERTLASERGEGPPPVPGFRARPEREQPAS